MTLGNLEKPQRLYKYQPYSTQSLDNFKERVLWFSKPSVFNDPFDSRLRVDLGFGNLTGKEWKDIYDHWGAKLVRMFVQQGGDRNQFEREFLTDGRPTQTFHDLAGRYAEQLYQRLHQEADSWGVACFSEKVGDLLMWSHYAQGHTGFCLEFDTSFDVFRKTRQVIYQEELPQMNILQLLRANAMDVLSAMITTKYKCWAYEKEWRAYISEGNTGVAAGWRALTGVYFGCKMPHVHKEVIALVLAESPTRLYEMNKDETRFAVHPAEVDFQAFDYKKESP